MLFSHSVSSASMIRFWRCKGSILVQSVTVRARGGALADALFLTCVKGRQKLQKRAKPFGFRAHTEQHLPEIHIGQPLRELETELPRGHFRRGKAAELPKRDVLIDNLV